MEKEKYIVLWFRYICYFILYQIKILKKIIITSFKIFENNLKKKKDKGIYFSNKNKKQETGI